MDTDRVNLIVKMAQIQTLKDTIELLEKMQKQAPIYKPEVGNMIGRLSNMARSIKDGTL